MSNKIEYFKGQKLGQCVFIRELDPKILSNGEKCRMAVVRCKCGSEFIGILDHVKRNNIVSCGCRKKSDYSGRVFNGIKYLYDIEPLNNHRRAMFECFCGNKFESFITCIVVGNTKSCGCKTHEWKSKASLTHGMSGTSMHDRWVNIKRRCLVPTCLGYENYGGRGIKIHNPWVNDFKSFYDYVKMLPFFGKEHYSLDRINNDGNYEPGNLRWASYHTQSANSRSKNKYGYKGIVKCRDRYQIKITVNYKLIHLGTFDSIKEAVNIRNRYILDNNLTDYPIQEYHG